MTSFVFVVSVSPLWERELFDIEELAATAVAATVAELDDFIEWPAVVAFADDACVQSLNREHLGKDAPTNVLAFPAPHSPTPTGPVYHETEISDIAVVPQAADEDEQCLGDIVLAYETLVREAEAVRIPVEDHVAHLIVHGFLHLQGYDHEAEDEAEIMENIERRALARMDVPDPYRGGSDA